MTLNTEFNLGTQSDSLFNELLDAHQGLSLDQSSQMNAAMILLLMNHIGDPAVIRDVIVRARASLNA